MVDVEVAVLVDVLDEIDVVVSVLVLEAVALDEDDEAEDAVSVLELLLVDADEGVDVLASVLDEDDVAVAVLALEEVQPASQPASLSLSRRRCRCCCRRERLPLSFIQLGSSFNPVWTTCTHEIQTDRLRGQPFAVVGSHRRGGNRNPVGDVLSDSASRQSR